ncbi:MAG: drug exporter of the superfamily-like protein [Actinomycetia bacterium]|nr:drug exporter of the superfamily-like protein [Actinomycetes bacterium]
MFAGLGRLIHRRRWISFALVLLLTVLCGWYGIGVFSRFSQGGFDDPHSASTRVATLSATYFGSTNPDVLAIYRDESRTVNDPTFMRDIVTTVARLPTAQVSSVISYWDSPRNLGALISTDRHSTYVAIQLAVPDLQKADAYAKVKDLLQVPGLKLSLGGAVPLGLEFATRTIGDVSNAEAISLPILFILTIMIFGAVVAAGLPLVVAIFSTIGGFAVVRVITLVTQVSSMALEVVTMMAAALAIDYSLFVLTRFREELARGTDRETALANTMATAGRTIAFSGITVTTALAGLLLFPQMFLRSIGLAGMSTVAVAVFGANVVLPTMLAILGPRIERGGMPWRRRKIREDRAERQFWYRLGHSVMRRPLPYFVIVLAILGVLFQPFLHAQFGTPDVRVLPAGSPTRLVVEGIKKDFPNGNLEPIDVVVRGDIIPSTWKKAGKLPTYLLDYQNRLAHLPGVAQAKVSGYDGGYGAVRISVTHHLDPASQAAKDLVQTIRAMKIPDQKGLVVYTDVGGSTAGQIDLMTSLMQTLPWMALFVGIATYVLLFAAFGSVLLPLKAVIMNMLSIGASFGVIVWGFQDGHLSGLLGFTPVGSVDATTMVFILAMVFGLSMDYEVFLLSRIREEWDRTHDNRAAVAVGMQKTGGIITSAAVLFLVVIGAFSLAEITVVKLIGVGMFVAVVVDAALVRSLLVPATMRFLGDANWWLPGPLAALHRKIDLREVHDLPAPDAVPAQVSVRESRRSGSIPLSVNNRSMAESPTAHQHLAYRGAPSESAQTYTKATVPPSYEAPRPTAPPPARPPAGQHRRAPAERVPWPIVPPTGTGAAPRTREIVPNPDGTGWHWRTAEDDDAS